MLTNSFFLRLKKLKACEILQRSIIEHDIEEIVTKKNQKKTKKRGKKRRVNSCLQAHTVNFSMICIPMFLLQFSFVSLRNHRKFSLTYYNIQSNFTEVTYCFNRSKPSILSNSSPWSMIPKYIKVWSFIRKIKIIFFFST